MYDERMGQSVTLTGRSIVRHMNAKVNEIATGEYDYMGEACVYSDTDSIANSSQILTTQGDLSVEQLFHLLPIKWVRGDKEYTTCPTTKVISYNEKTGKAEYRNINYVYRHKVKKPRWRITDSLGNKVECTSDHSIMVERDGVLIEIKPADIIEGDLLISFIDK